jgi:hypothetical protein
MEPAMDILDLNKDLPPRAGQEYRLNQQRYFHVMNQGWYFHTREGIHGPYLKKDEACDYLEEHITRQTPDPSDSWRLT